MLNLIFDKSTHCNALFMIASKKAAAVFSQKVPNSFNRSVASVKMRYNASKKETSAT